MKLSIFFRNNFRNKSAFLTFFLIFIILFLVHCFATSGKFHVFEYLVYLGIFGAGLWFIRATLLFFVSENVTSGTLILIVFGSNLFYLAGVEHLLQPILLFSLYAGVIYFTTSAYRSPRISKTVFLAVFSGLAILAQPIGYVVLLIPLLWGIHDKKSVLENCSGIRKNDRNILIFVNILLLMIFIAVVFLKINPGEIGFLDFRLPGVFYLNFRYVWNNLFSFDHGWLTYSPAMLLAAVGFYFLAERKREIFLSIFVVCVMEILAESCWTKLGKTEVFGQIAFVQLIALLSLPTAFFLKVIAEKKGITRFFIAIICVCFLVLNLFQTWQYDAGIILKTDMTPEIYCNVFGRTDFKETEIQRMAGFEPGAASLLKETPGYTSRVLAFYDFEDSTISYKDHLESAYCKSGKLAFRLNTTFPYSPGVKIPYAELTSKKNVIARITVSVFSPDASVFADGSIVFTSIHEGINFRVTTLNLGTLRLHGGEWYTETLDYLLPAYCDPGDLFAAFIYYTGNSALYIDDLKIELLEP